ncbi:MAG: phosphoribosylformylglycinamidine cyclo-ligase, partial [Mammaliicoccus vitulinus]
IATNKVDPETIEAIVSGVSVGCKETNCALIGGETAEMGEMYHQGEYDIAGFCVGAVEKDAYIDGSTVDDGDILIGIKSSGIHSNGYSLVRNLIKESEIDLNDQFDENRTYLEAFLEPTKLYVKPVLSVLEKVKVKGMSHITGGGFIENIPRAIPEDKDADIDVSSYEVPKIFDWLKEQGKIEATEMYNVFNMGIGFVLIVNKEDQEETLNILKGHNEEAFVIGKISNGTGNVNLSGVQS